MNRRFLFISLLILSAICLFAGGGSGEEFEYVEGNVIIQTLEFMTVLQREPNLITDQTWFNESSSYFQ